MKTRLAVFTVMAMSAIAFLALPVFSQQTSDRVSSLEKNST